MLVMPEAELPLVAKKMIKTQVSIVAIPQVTVAVQQPYSNFCWPDTGRTPAVACGP
jgi:hypothetical protein